MSVLVLVVLFVDTCLYPHTHIHTHTHTLTHTHSLTRTHTHSHTHSHTLTVSNSLQYECCYNITDDYPPNSDPSNIIFRTGDKIVQIGDTSVKDKGPDDFALLLQKEACEGTSIRIVPRLSPPPSITSLSLGYGSLDGSDRSGLSRRPSEQQLMSSLTMKVSNLLSMRPPG